MQAVYSILHYQAGIGGVGLGLAVCRGIFQRHRGKIEVQSRDREYCFYYLLTPVTHRKTIRTLRLLLKTLTKKNDYSVFIY